MRLTDKIKTKLPFFSDYYNQHALVWRNRGSSYALEIIKAVRVKYGDKPNRHELSTGEVIPAVPKDYVGNMVTGSDFGSYICLVEGRDDQLVAFKHDFTLPEEKITGQDKEEFSFEQLPTEIDTQMPGKEISERLVDKGFNAVNFTVLDQRDERFTFLSEELQTSQDKYTVGNFIHEHGNVVNMVAGAVAFAIIMYVVWGDVGQAMQTFGEQSGKLVQAMNDLAQASQNNPPPGQ